jgi:hypothetical protein
VIEDERPEVNSELLLTLDRKVDKIMELLKGDDFHPNGMVSQLANVESRVETVHRESKVRDAALDAKVQQILDRGWGMLIGGRFMLGLIVGGGGAALWKALG